MRLRPLSLIVGALAATAILRAGLSVFGAPPLPPALTGIFGSQAEAASTSHSKEPEPAPAPEPVVAQCDTPEEMLRAIADERLQLEAQKEALARRASEIALAEEKMGIERGNLNDLKTEMEDLLARSARAQSEDLQRLVGLYSNMKPKEAAAIMNDLDIEVTVLVIGTMPERDAAPILANLDPVRARAISRIILERSKLPGDQRLDNLKL